MPKPTDEGDIKETKDIRALHKVVNEWMRGAGCALDVQFVVKMLSALLKIHGTDFSVEKACDALTRLAEAANLIKQTLQKEYETSSE